MAEAEAGKERFKNLSQAEDEDVIADSEGLLMLGAEFSGLVNIRDLGGQTNLVVNQVGGTYSTVMCCW